jgi:hypothetical protein
MPSFTSWSLISGELKAALRTYTLPNVVSLSLSDMTHIPLAPITNHCPRLQHLSLDSAHFDSTKVIPNRQFNLLHSLEISGPCGGDLVEGLHLGLRTITHLRLGLGTQHLDLPGIYSDLLWQNLTSLEIGRSYFSALKDDIGLGMFSLCIIINVTQILS